MAVNYTFNPPDTAPLDPGSTRSNKPKILMADFGDGYSQRARDGINHNSAERQFSWTNLTEDEADAIDNFFNDRGGDESFFYNHRNKGVKVYICPEWTVTDVAFDIYTITATFKQVFDL